MKLVKILFILLTCNAFAQDNFIQGTITTINGSKIQGELNYQDWKKTPETVQFRVGGSIKEYAPEELKSFEVESDKYISRKVTLDVTEQRLQKMDKTLKAKFEDRHIFLNVLAEGEVNLYEYYGIRTHYFAEKNEEFQELIIRKYFTENNRDLLTNKKYIGQLKVFLNNCKAIAVNESLNYKRKELTKLVSKYNDCVNTTDTKEVYTKDVNQQTSFFYATAGFGINNYTVDGNKPFIRDFEGGSFAVPSIGVAYELLLAKNRAKWSIYNELTYAKYKYTEDNENKLGSSFDLYSPLELDISSLNINVLFRYKFLKESKQKVVPFINFGLGSNFIISENNTIIKTNTFNNEQTELPLEINKQYFTYSVGAGAVYDKFTLELRYNRSDKITEAVGEESSLSQIGLVFSYKLN